MNPFAQSALPYLCPGSGMGRESILSCQAAWVHVTAARHSLVASSRSQSYLELPLRTKLQLSCQAVRCFVLNGATLPHLGPPMGGVVAGQDQ